MSQNSIESCVGIASEEQNTVTARTFDLLHQNIIVIKYEDYVNISSSLTANFVLELCESR